MKLSSNENPLGASPRALLAAHQALAEGHRYPDAAAQALRGQLAERLGVAPEEVLVGNGSNELLELLVRTFCNGGHVVFGDPAFDVYRLACQAHGVDHTAVPLLSDLRHDLPAMARAVGSETRLVFIANPNNPTGTIVSRAELRRFLDSVPREVLVVLDEAYFEYVDDPDYPNGLKLRAEYPRVVVVRTFSKIYGLAALRLGYAVMAPELAEFVHRVRAPFNVNAVAQAAGVAALGDTQHVTQSAALNRSEREFLSQGLTDLGLQVTPSQANFVLVDTGRSSADVYQGLLKRRVIVRPIAPLPNCLRITVGTRADNERLLDGLRQVLAA